MQTQQPLQTSRTVQEDSAWRAHLTLMLAFASAENMVALTPLRLAICCPTAARMQQSATCSTWWMCPDRSASANLQHYVNLLNEGRGSYSVVVHYSIVHPQELRNWALGPQGFMSCSGSYSAGNLWRS